MQLGMDWFKDEINFLICVNDIRMNIDLVVPCFFVNIVISRGFQCNMKVNQEYFRKLVYFNKTISSITITRYILLEDNM